MHNRAKNLAFKLGDVEQGLAELSRRDYTCAVFDPPRSGLTEGLIKKLNNSALERIIYVSCNPLTLKRDIMLMQQRFRLVSLKGVDMFPHTDHIECVALLKP